MFDRKAARARCDAATEGPWWDNPVYCVVQTGSGKLHAICRYGNSLCVAMDADFIAHARTDLPAALTLLDRCGAMLRGLEWDVGCGNDPGCCCVSCGEQERHGHGEGCELAELLDELKR